MPLYPIIYTYRDPHHHHHHRHRHRHRHQHQHQHQQQQQQQQQQQETVIYHCILIPLNILINPSVSINTPPKLV